MAAFFPASTAATAAPTSRPELTEVFHLEDQLRPDH